MEDAPFLELLHLQDQDIKVSEKDDLRFKQRKMSKIDGFQVSKNVEILVDV